MDNIRRCLNLMIIASNIFIVIVSQNLPIAGYSTFLHNNQVNIGYLYLIPPQYVVQSSYYIVYKFISLPLTYHVLSYNVIILLMITTVLHLYIEYRKSNYLSTIIISIVNYIIIFYSLSIIARNPFISDVVETYGSYLANIDKYIKFEYGPLYYILLIPFILEAIYALISIIYWIKPHFSNTKT